MEGGTLMEMPIAIHKDKDSVYGVTIPDVPGCYSWGNTIDEAIKNTREAVYSHFEVMAENGCGFDITVSRIEDLSKEPEYAGAIWALVDLDASKFDTKPERAGLTELSVTTNRAS
jgi:predicted RNase H-like HicB family nuclease